MKVIGIDKIIPEISSFFAFTNILESSATISFRFFRHPLIFSM